MSLVDKSDVLIVRAAFVLLLGGLTAAFLPFGLTRLPAAGTGVVAGLIVVGIEMRLRRASLRPLIAGAAGMLIGTVLGVLLVALLAFSSVHGDVHGPFLEIAVPLCAAYIGLVVGLSNAECLNLSSIGVLSGTGGGKQLVKLLDTSVLIDGRIADIAESGFLDGSLAIPQFVLRELQMVADSSESMKRNRGRRGLDVVQRLQKIPRVRVQLIDEDAPNIKEVDLKLIELAKINRCSVMTNDFNLNKVAQVHGVEVLNINELANALRPVVLPGESMRVFILKEGKEHNQGVAYLDDGTMVVVDNAKRYISRTIDVTVTSVLQTTAGKMIFGKFDERAGDRPLHPSPEKHAVAHSAQASSQAV